MLTIGIRAARARLANLADDGWLSAASERAYQDGLGHLLWAGPAGSPPGLSRLACVKHTGLVSHIHSVTLGMRWEAVGITGGPFPALDANITLDPRGDQATRIILTGVYRSPVGPLGGGLDRVLLHKVITATSYSLMTRLSRALETSPLATDEAGAPRSREAGPETAT